MVHSIEQFDQIDQQLQSGCIVCSVCLSIGTLAMSNIGSCGSRRLLDVNRMDLYMKNS